MKLRSLLASAALMALPLQAAAATPATVRVDFDARSIRTVVVEGQADRATARPVTIDDPVRIASVSKMFVAFGVMRLVDKGKLDLDRDVSDYLGWRLRNPAFPDKAITLRLLLSHQASVSDAADYLIPVDQTIRAKMADPKAWDNRHAPGSGWFAYANLSFPIIASVMERASGERFDRVIDREVIRPLGLKACFNWSPCTQSDAARAVVLYRATGEVARDDLKSQLPPCPGIPAADASCDMQGYRIGWNGAIYSPQGGLRISARDLAKTGQMLLRNGKGFLKPSSFDTLVRVHWTYDGTNGVSEEGAPMTGFFCAYGLAIHTIGSGGKGCNDDPFGDGRQRIGHSGDAYGLRSGLWVDMAAGKGTAFFTTAVAPDAQLGRSAFTAVEERVLQTPSVQPDK